MNLLALDTSTERMSLAVQRGDVQFSHDTQGGALASASLIPSIMALLAQAGLQLSDLQAICLGQGPGAFTGLRTACAVAQGLALGANLPVLPIDTLLCVAEAARTDGDKVLVVMDARMSQVYVGAYEWHDDQWSTLQAPHLASPLAVQAPTDWAAAGFVMAGNAWHKAELQAALQHLRPTATRLIWPQATALLRLGQAAWARGEAVAPDAALPVYVRDQVALTTAERLALKAGTA